MAIIESRVNTAKRMLEDVVAFDVMVAKNNFEPDTVTDMKGNAKDLCDAAKAEIDAIKGAINEWG